MVANRNFTARNENPTTPMIFPTTSPKKMPIADWLRIAAPNSLMESATPAFANAKRGKIMKLTHGCKLSSRRSPIESVP